MSAVAQVELALMDDVARFVHDPLGFTRYIYPWGEGALAGTSGPRSFQREILSDLRDHLQDSTTRFTPYLAAIASGHGIGKSALMGHVLNWGLSTCELARAIVTAGTGKQLETKTWPEVSKWFQLGINAHWFDVKAESISVAAEPSLARQWRADRVTWSVQNPQAFAGLHNLRRRIIVIFDEASTIDDKVWEVTEGALTDEKTEIIWLAFGQPEKITGRFFDCFHRFKHRWKTKQIDARTVEGTNRAQLQKVVDDWGEDHDVTRVRVRGVFPRASVNQLIAQDLVFAARHFKATDVLSVPLIHAWDVARYGDDQTVGMGRRGRIARYLDKLRGKSIDQVGEHIISHIKKDAPDAVVIDADGLGAGVVDYVRARGYQNIFEFHGGAPAFDPDTYFNLRSQCWCEVRGWLKGPAQIPDDNELETDLTGPMYHFSNKGQLALERKEDMKARGLASPDCGDALAMTFGVRVAPKSVVRREPPRQYGAWS